MLFTPINSSYPKYLIGNICSQIARELRLRDIGGIIVVDFIDMVDECKFNLPISITPLLPAHS